MKNHSKAKEEFNKKIAELEKENKPALYEQNLKEVVLYEKMLEMQEQISELAASLNNKK